MRNLASSADPTGGTGCTSHSTTLHHNTALLHNTALQHNTYLRSYASQKLILDSYCRIIICIHINKYWTKVKHLGIIRIYLTNCSKRFVQINRHNERRYWHRAEVWHRDTHEGHVTKYAILMHASIMSRSCLIRLVSIPLGRASSGTHSWQGKSSHWSYSVRQAREH